MATQPLPAAGRAGHESGLDPSDWDAFRAVAHRMLDDSLDHIAGRREQPVWQPMPDAVRGAFDGPLPRAPEGLESALAKLQQDFKPVRRNTSSMSHLWIADPNKPGLMSRLFSTHPPIPDRIARLERNATRL